MGKYKVRASRDDDRWWFVEVPELGHVTQGRNVTEAEFMARDLIALVTEQPIEDIEVEVDWVLPGAAAEHLERADQLRHQAAAANTNAAKESRAAARELRNAGLGLKDIGALLGVSYQRAHQLVAEK